MRQTFNNIAEFIDHKKFCPFCKSSLKPKLTNFELFQNKLPLLNSKIKDNKFIFDCKLVSFRNTIVAVGYLDIITNEIEFEIKEESCYEDVSLESGLCEKHGISYQHMIEVFEHFKPNIQLDCKNKSCKMDYGCSSNVLTCERASERWAGHYHNYSNHTRIKPFLAYLDTCSFDKYTVQNDHIYNKTRIYSTAKLETDPVEIPLISFESFDKDKLKTRISTIITFG